MSAASSGPTSTVNPRLHFKGDAASGNANGNTNVGGFVGLNGGQVLSSVARGNANGVKNVGGLIGQNGGSDQYGNVWDATVQGDTAFGNASGSENVGALIGLNDNGGAGQVSVINNSAFGASIVNGNDTGTLIGLDNGASSNNNTYEDLPAQKGGRAIGGATASGAGRGGRGPGGDRGCDH